MFSVRDEVNNLGVFDIWYRFSCEDNVQECFFGNIDFLIMSVKANGSPRIYLPQITNRGALNRRQDLFKPSQGNPFAPNYGREKSRDQLFQRSGLNSNRENSQNTSGFPLPKIAKETPKKRKTWGKVIDKRSIEEENPSKRGSWSINETHTSVPKLYNPYGSKVREVPFTSFESPDEGSSSFEVGDSVGGSANGKRRKQWSRPNKSIARQEIPVSIDEERENDLYNGDQEADPYQGMPKIIYDRHGPVTATYEPSYGGPPIPTNHNPNYQQYYRTPRNRRPGQPPSSDSNYALNTGSTRSDETPNIDNLLDKFASDIDNEAYVNLNRHSKPNIFGDHHRPFYPSPSNFVVSPPPRAKTKAKPVLSDKRASAPTRPAQREVPETSAQSKVPKNVPSANNALSAKPPISGKVVKNVRNKIIPEESDKSRAAKYTYTIEEGEKDGSSNDKKSHENCDDRPAKYTFTKDDDDRPAKYTYTVDKNTKPRTVTFQDENKKNSKKSDKKSKVKNKSKATTRTSSDTSSQRDSVKESNATDQSDSSLTPGRRNWSPPTGELFDEDPRQFWVDMNTKKEGKKS